MQLSLLWLWVMLALFRSAILSPSLSPLFFDCLFFFCFPFSPLFSLSQHKLPGRVCVLFTLLISTHIGLLFQEDQSVAQAAPTSANPQLYLGNEPKEDSASQARRRLQLLQQQVHTVLTENMEYEYHLHTLRERERTLEDERHFLALRLACHMQMTVERPRTAPRGTFALQNDYLPSKETVLQLVQQQQQAYHSARRQLHVLTKLAAMRGFKRPAGTVAPETASASRATLAPELETVANVQKPPSASTARTHLPDGAYLDPPAKRHASADMSLPVETSDVGQHKRKVEDAELLSQISAQPRKRPRLTTDKDSQSSAATHPAEPSAAIPAVQAATPVSQMESPAVNLGAALFPEAPAHVEAASSESKSRSRAKSSPSAGGVKKEASKAKKRAAQLQEGLQLPRDANLRVLLPFTLGTVTVEALGTVVFDREKYHTSSYIFPVGFRCQRIHRVRGFHLAHPTCLIAVGVTI